MGLFMLLFDFVTVCVGLANHFAKGVIHMICRIMHYGLHLFGIDPAIGKD